ncbi:MAG: SURF1 family protein [Gemmatimonadaceae bacterium]|nr:SURF1 family protein [Gemmatimonadaceae bacterium]
MARVRTRAWVFAGIAVAIAALFARLGVWQLDRLAWRRTVNARVEARLAQPPVDPFALPRDSAALRYRRAIARGRFLWAHELVLTTRTRNGSPGVWLVTPLRIADRDTLVLVVRGWVYAPDGETVDLMRWREGDTTQVIDGFVLPLAEAPGATTIPGRVPIAFRQLDVVSASRMTGAPVLPLLLVQRGDSNPRAVGVPPRLVPPRLDEANHQSYAIQWFSFAIMALVSAALFVRGERRRARAP